MHLYLRNNNLREKGAISILKNLSKLKNLIDLVLYVGENSIGTNGAIKITKGIANLDKLKSLIL